MYIEKGIISSSKLKKTNIVNNILFSESVFNKQKPTK